MIRPLPEFTPDDWRPAARRVTFSDREAALVGQWLAEARADHEDDRHEQGQHPWCWLCDVDQLLEDAGMRDALDLPVEYLESVDEDVQGRALRYLRLHGRPPKVDLTARDRPRVQAIGGDTFMLDHRDAITAIWGDGEDVGWAQGESLLLCGLPGTGKTTLAGQLLRARLGLRSTFLTMPVRPTASKVLYLAMDRPGQIARALSRHFTEDDRDLLRERLIIWPGPPPSDLAADTDTLARMAYEHGADTVVVDSLKDAVVGLAEDGPGAAYNRARQTAIAAGVELLELHHMTKRGGGGGKPEALADVYGSAFLTAGAGSVIVLNGDPGDAVVELRHLKQPSGVIGPWKILHDSHAGESTIFHSADLVALARAHSEISAKDAAKAITENDKPSANDIEKARRRLDSLTRAGQLQVVQEGDRSTATPTLWGPADQLPTTFTHTFTAPPATRTITTASRPSPSTTQQAQTQHHADLHDLHGVGPSRSAPPLEGGGSESDPTRTPPHSCGICHQPLAAALVEDGETTHPTCAHQEAS